MRSLNLKILLLLALLTLSGCTGIAKGITQAIIEKETQDTKQCEITGFAYPGIRQSLLEQTKEDKPKTTKVLMVHGISKHLPGYSTLFRDKLVKELSLTKVSDGYKEIIIRHSDYIDENGDFEDLGVLRVTKHTNLAETRSLLFYELTWSQISDPSRDELAFDNSGEYSYRRASINHTLKMFFNNTIPDLMVYRGTSKEKINHAVSQAACWTFVGGWEDLPAKGAHYCDVSKEDLSNTIVKDDYFFVTHSLGSRITVDTIAYAVFLSNTKGASSNNAKNAFDALKQKDFTVFMLSNQLPLLQLGLEKPKITDQEATYCNSESNKYNERIFNNLNLIAFSDPNDILSYPIPPNYAKNNIDSRLCSNIVNVSINVTEVKDAFGFNFANPAEAHGGYHGDDRIISLVADGLNRENEDSLVSKKCKWTETIRKTE